MYDYILKRGSVSSYRIMCKDNCFLSLSHTKKIIIIQAHHFHISHFKHAYLCCLHVMLVELKQLSWQFVSRWYIK